MSATQKIPPVPTTGKFVGELILAAVKQHAPNRFAADALLGMLYQVLEAKVTACHQCMRSSAPWTDRMDAQRDERVLFDLLEALEE